MSFITGVLNYYGNKKQEEYEPVFHKITMAFKEHRISNTQYMVLIRLMPPIGNATAKQIETRLRNWGIE